MDYTERAQTNLKRDEVSWRPISGGQITCSNADLCAYLNHYLDRTSSSILNELITGGHIRDELDWVWGVAGGPSLNDPIGYPLSGSVHDDLVETMRRIGTEYSDLLNVFDLLHNIMDEATTASSNAAAAVDNTNAIQNQLGYSGHPGQQLYADIQTIKTGLSGQASTLATLLGDIVAVQTTLANVALGIVASWPKSGIGDLVQSIGDFLLGQGAGPGSGHLSIGSSAAIVNGSLVSKPTGAYGLQLNLNVPGTWGRIDSAPNVYIPAVGRLAQFSTWGTAGTPLPIETEFPTFYPLHPACQQVSIELGVGVTGTRAWLLLT